MKKSNVLMIGMFALVVIILPLSTFFSQKTEISENENRTLAKWEKISLKTYFNEEFMNNFDSYLADHFVAREKWIQANVTMELILGKQEINGVFIIDNQMIEKKDSYDNNVYQKHMDSIQWLKEMYKDTKIYLALAPTVQEMYKDELLCKVIEQSKFKADVELSDTLLEHKKEYIYYRTDHHWTTYGAYLAYVQLGESLGYIPYAQTDFDIEAVTDNFRGTLYSKTLDKTVKPDIIEVYRLKNHESLLSVEYVGKNRGWNYDTIFFEEYLDKKDKYCYFLGTNTAVVNIENKEINNGKSLLLIKDSYANCLIPFLINHYERITVIDTRYSEYIQLKDINPNAYDETLLLYNVFTFTDSSTALGNIRFFSNPANKTMNSEDNLNNN